MDKNNETSAAEPEGIADTVWLVQLPVLVTARAATAEDAVEMVTKFIDSAAGFDCAYLLDADVHIHVDEADDQEVEPDLPRPWKRN